MPIVKAFPKVESGRLLLELVNETETELKVKEALFGPILAASARELLGRSWSLEAEGDRARVTVDVTERFLEGRSFPAKGRGRLSLNVDPKRRRSADVC